MKLDERVYCYAVLCPLWEKLGGYYREDQRQPLKAIAEVSQLIWFRLHHNKLFFWLVENS